MQDYITFFILLIISFQVFVANSYKNTEVGHPFGYLKASTNLTCVNLFVMPYNYPVLLPLLDELFKVSIENINSVLYLNIMITSLLV